MTEKKQAEAPQTVRLRFRRACTIDGTAYQALALAAVEATPEAWAAVNRGEADLEPGPGVDGQPFPPEELTTAPAPPTALELQQQAAAQGPAGRPAAAAGPKGKPAAAAGAEEHAEEPGVHHGKHVSPPGSAHGHTKAPDKGK
jgi:hypothetical protein